MHALKPADADELVADELGDDAAGLDALAHALANSPTAVIAAAAERVPLTDTSSLTA
jgi:hypothetical protein